MSTVNLKIPPVVLGLIALMLMLLDRWLPLYRIVFPFQGGLSACIIILGAWVILFAVITFVQLRATVDPRNPEKARRLVVAGRYRYSRNPMYFGIFLILLGIAIYRGALSAIIVFPAIYCVYRSLSNRARGARAGGQVRQELPEICPVSLALV